MGSASSALINRSLDSIHVMEASITSSHLGGTKEGVREEVEMEKGGQNNAIRKMLFQTLSLSRDEAR